MAVGLTIGAAVLIVTLVGGGTAAAVVFLSEARDAQRELNEARQLISEATGLLAEDRADELQTTVVRAQAKVTSALEIVQGPLWDFAAEVPFVGANVQAVQLTTAAIDVLATDALPTGLSLMSTLRPEQLRLEGGGFNLQPLVDAQSALPELSVAFNKALRIVQGIDRTQTIPLVDDTIGEVIDLVEMASPAIDEVERLLPTILPMLGSEGPRNYLLIFQNLAEIRATGGNPAATAMIRVDGGSFELDRQADSQTFYREGTVGVDYSGWSGETLGIYEEDTTWYSQNYTRTPHFPTTARMFNGLWAATTGVAPDGVISIDPVVLAYLLGVTGSITADGVELTAENAVQAVLSDSYARYPRGDDSDVFFADVASQVFDHIAAGKWDPLEMLDALQRSVTEQRVYGWFPREAEQALAEEVGIDGRLAVDNLETTEVGIFLNDWSVGKLQYWLSTSVDVTCSPETRTVTTSIAMTNSIPHNDFVGYVLGHRPPRLGMPRTTMLLNVLYYAPPGVGIDSVDVSAGHVAGYDRAGTEEGRAAHSVMVAVPMGETRVVSYVSTLPADGDFGPVSLRYTPTVTTTPTTIAEACDELTSIEAPTG